MKPIPFPEQNKVYTAPENFPYPCLDLPVRQVPGAITACYEFDGDDLTLLMKGKHLYFTIHQDVQPVVSWEIR